MLTVAQSPNSTILEKEQNLNYEIYLNELGLQTMLRGPWVVVGQSAHTQGWKLHISTIPRDAIALLDRIIPCLLEHNVPCFKIAKDTMTLRYLNEGELGVTHMGKFMTIYPDNDEAALLLAHELVKLTQGMHGPRIVSDLPLGDVVSTRYGCFNPIIQHDRLGAIRLMIYAPDGSLIDENYNAPYKPPEGFANPFHNWSLQKSYDKNAEPKHILMGKKTKLFGPGYLILDVLKTQPKGSVFQAIDLRTQASVAMKIIKQGKRFFMTDFYNRDMRDRLQYQANLHQKLANLLPIPFADPYFEIDGDGYLPLEWIDGERIDAFIIKMLDDCNFGMVSLNHQKLLWDWCQKLIQVVVRLHNLGYVHRDLTPSTIWLGANEKLYLLNLEFCHALSDATPAYGLGTPGFMSPQQARGENPAIEDDIYTIGCLFIFLLTGMDPRRLIHQDDQELMQRLIGITQGAPIAILEMSIACVNADASLRPSLVTVSSVLSKEIEKLKLQKNILEKKHIPAPKISSIELQSVLTRGIVGLLQHNGALQTDDGLWLSASHIAPHQGTHNDATRYELKRGAHHGVAGVVYALSRFARFGLLPAEGIARVRHAVNWLQHTHGTLEDEQPGLHFGTSGVAMALTETIAAGIEKPTEALCSIIRTNLTGNIDWPDITHGAAGQGIANMYCSDRLKWSLLQTNIQHCVDYLIETQRPDGAWMIPKGSFNHTPGEIMTGFASGTAGIAYFLAEFAFREKDDAVWMSAIRAMRWLQKHAVLQKSRGNTIMSWRHSNINSSMSQWWSHGGPGIALTFLRVFELTGESTYASEARKALRVHPINICNANLSQCNGLSGLGDIYVEALRIFGEEEWQHRAHNVARILCSMAHVTETGELYWLTENAHVATAGLMVGSAGILHFLMRLYQGGKLAGPALLLDEAL